METPETQYGLENVDDFVRAKDHEETFHYTDTTEFEGTNDSYKKFKRIFPVVYVLLQIDGKPVKVVIDGWKYVLFARANGIKEIFSCHLKVDDEDDIVSAMIHLQRSNHNSDMATYWMIQKLWDKHYLGQGHRSDTKEEELDTAIVGPDGRKLNIYQRIGLELNISGNKVKHIRKVGMIKPLHFERIEIGRFSLYQAYLECLKQERGELAPVPSIKAPVYHTTTTGTPQFSLPSSTADVITDQVVNNEPDDHADNATSQETPTKDSNRVENETDDTDDVAVDEIPVGTVHSFTDEYVIVRGNCRCCKHETLLKIFKSK